MKTNFVDYLKKEGLTHKNITIRTAAVKLFLNWLTKQSIEAEQCSYTDVLAYMKHCQQREVTQSTIQNYLWIIKHFYAHLIGEGQIKTNPVSGIKVQGVKRRTLYHIFQPQELNALYNSQAENTLPEKKHKVMLGLLVFQGLSVSTLSGLEVTDIKLKAGQIEIRGGRTSNARTLSLESSQYLTIHEYLTQTREKILAQSKEQTTKLIMGQHGGRYFSNLVQDLLRPLKKQHKNLKNAKQLRASVIVKWLRHYNLREVQYLAGHRYISSTESYQQSDMEGLSEEVHKFHPLG